MSTEQLTLILDALGNMGAGGKEAFIWWLLIAEALPVLAWGSVGLGVIYTSYRVMKDICIDDSSASKGLMRVATTIIPPHLRGYRFDPSRSIDDLEKVVREAERLVKIRDPEK